MAFKYALARIGNYTLRKSAREFGTNRTDARPV